MLFDEMLGIAQNAAAQQAGRLGFNDTICVARTASGRIVIGISSTTMMNNMPMAIHAEADLCNKLMADMDTAVAEMSLFSAANFQPVLPCNDCIGRLIGMNNVNAGTILILPDRAIPLSQAGSLMQNPAPPPTPAMNPFAGGQMNGGFNGMGAPQGFVRPMDQQSLSLEQLQGMSPVRNTSMGLSRAVSDYTANRDSDDSGFLKSRLNQILSDDIDEDEPEEKPKKKFKLFK